MAGILYVVATPIGNLEDISYRAVRILKEADWVACEDTRHSRKLLDHYGIKTQMVSYHEHNEQSRTADLLTRLQSGATVALISDAGTPLLSDPGYRLVTAAVQASIPVVPVPGASALLSALAASGVATDAFYFGGFLPSKASARRSALESVKPLRSTAVFYEAPHRIIETLREIDAVLGERPLVVARELTKLHEEFLRGTAVQILAELTAREGVRGEITIVIGKPESEPVDERPLREVLDQHLNNGMSRMDAIKAIARERGLPKRQVYAELEEAADPGA